MSSTTTKRIVIRNRTIRNGILKTQAFAVEQVAAIYDGNVDVRLIFDCVEFDEFAVSAVLEMICDHPKLASSAVQFNCCSGNTHLVVDGMYSHNVSSLTVVSRIGDDHVGGNLKLLKSIAGGLAKTTNSSSSSRCGLTHLKLNFQNFSQTTGEIFERPLAESKTLKAFSLEDMTIQPTAILFLTNAFSKNPSLESIYLYRCRMTDTDSARLMLSVKDHPKLKNYGVDSRYFNVESFRSLAAVMESQNCHLETINLRASAVLRSNRLHDSSLGCNSKQQEAFDPLMISLARNTSLVDVILANRQLSDQTIQNIGIMLAGNTSLRFLDMTNCQITDVGLSTLAGYLPRMKGLQKLWIGGRHQNFGRDSVRKLVLEGLRDNTSIVDLILPRQHQSYFYKRFAYYTSLNAAGRRLLQLERPIHPALWALVLERANRFVRFTSQDTSRVYTSQEDLLYYFIRNGLVTTCF